MILVALLAFSGCALGVGGVGWAESEHRTPGVLALLPSDATTEHTLQMPAGTLRYTAKAGTLALFDQNGERSAAIFYTAYTVVPDGSPRPLTFAFNGGPGASSAYLHLGLAGPRLLDLSRMDGSAAALRDSPDTWLRFTDLVFIDPVGTGWSRAPKADGNGAFWGVRQDAQTLAKVIALYVAQNARSASPKFLLGESYGGFRALKVARALLQDQGMATSGIIVVSPFLDGALTFGGDRFALGAALQLPSLAAAQLDRTGRFTPEALADAERFAMTEYLVTLAGRPPDGEAGRAFYARVAELTGLPAHLVAQKRGFIRDAFVKNVRADRSEIVSAYDAAVATPDPFPESESAEGGDPVLDGYTQALGGAFVGYAREELGFRTDLTYLLLNREVSGKWDWNDGGRRNQASAVADIRELLALNPSLRLLIAHGRSDLVTPYAASRYVLDHLPPLGNPERVRLKVYKGGHMMYLAPEPRAALAADAAALYRGDGS